MTSTKTFINRRKGTDRRYDEDPCRDLPIDMYHRKRRKTTERRSNRTLLEDYYAFTSEGDIPEEVSDVDPNRLA